VVNSSTAHFSNPMDEALAKGFTLPAVTTVRRLALTSWANEDTRSILHFFRDMDQMGIYLNGFKGSVEPLRERDHHGNLDWAMILPYHRNESIATFEKYYPDDKVPLFEFFFD